MPNSPLVKPFSAGEIHLWNVQTPTAIDHGWLDRYADLLSAEERDRHDRFLFEKTRHQFLISHVLVRLALSQYAHTSAGDWRFALGPHGKPEIIAEQNDRNLRFNLSHCKGLAICGITRNDDLGVDCENTERKTDFCALAQRYFATSEAEQVVTAAPSQTAEKFFRFWTLKEAYVKAHGQGLSLPLQKFAFYCPPNQPISISFSPPLQDSPSHWHFATPQMGGTYKIAVALRSQAARDLDVVLHDACRHFPPSP